MKRLSGPARSSASSPGAAVASALKQSAAPDELWELLIEFSLSQRVWWTEICDGLGLTPTQGLALRLLDPRTPMAMNALAENLVCDASNVTGVVDKLEARGLIERKAAENDRRVKMLAVTDKGRELRKRLFMEAAKAPAPIATLPKDVRQKLSVALRALVAERTGFSAAV
jgi:DNA-binding MarR family transcriptional regulator